MNSLFVSVLLLMMLGTNVSQAATCTLAVTVNDAITASTTDYLERAEKRAVENGCESIFVRVNTPGGSLQSTRRIVERMLASKIPYLCLITPQGGHAGSAGAIILQACHVNGGVKATNVGAATPILGTGEKMPDDLRNKMINDTVSWLEGVTKLRGRDLKFSKDIVTDAKSYSSTEAVEMKALDILAEDEADFLKKSEGRKVLIAGNETIEVKVGDLREFSPDTRYRILSFIADPEFAYLLFMGSLGLLYVELTHPGLVAPGVIGGIGLVFSLIAFHKLEVVWGGLALILLGIGFLIAEIFIPSFGILGIGGLVSLFVGSVFLFDKATGYSLPYSIILPVVLAIGAVFFGIGYLALKTLRLKSKDSDADLKESLGVVVSVDPTGHKGQIAIMGETWNFVSEDSLNIAEHVAVTDRQGLTLNVKKYNKE
ncbi:NfeD family protein [Bdellovibrio sp. HCB288]|uniref:NfeD family protein n=1 Tax=Bdellovibrio sp. HCB288 TaxID=3394355 RepID=UPI0039B37811